MQLSDELLAVLDARAARERRSRSELIRDALERYLKADLDREVDRAIVEAYTREPDDEFDYADAAKRLIAEEPW